MTDRVHPPVTGSLPFWRAWCREHGGVLKVVHRNPRGVISIVQGGWHHVDHLEKWGHRDKKYCWGSSFPVDWLARVSAGHHKANPDRERIIREAMR